jgi:N6-L-threonylcarbamoyladenine synthase
MDITILGIESSCDDTSAAVIRNTTLLSNVIASQAVHVKYGGVIPELASRAHQQNIIPVVDTALKEAGVTADKIDAIAFTRGPGLLGSLLVGTSFAKGLAIANNIPMVEVNHLQGHILSHLSNASPAASSMVVPIISISNGELTFTICVCPPLTKRQRNG